MTGSRNLQVVTGVALAALILAYQLWPFMWHGFFYQLEALGISLLLFAFWRTTKWVVVEIGLWLSINNLADELLFDPTRMGSNEAFFAIIVTFLILRKCRQPTKKRTSSPN